MTDYHLRFTDRDEAVAVLEAAGIPDGPTHDSAVDHVGEVVLVPAVMDGDEELEPAVIDAINRYFRDATRPRDPYHPDNCGFDGPTGAE